MADVLFTPRFERKAALFEGRLLTKVDQKIAKISAMDVDSLLRESRNIKSLLWPEKVWLTKVGIEYRLIFRRTGPNSIEVMDIVAHEDLDKYVRAGS